MADLRIVLEIVVSHLNGIADYGFAFDGQPVATSGGKGIFKAVPDRKKLLEWVMIGDPGATMKVEILRNGAAIYTRDASTIPPPLGKAYDAFMIDVR